MIFETLDFTTFAEKMQIFRTFRVNNLHIWHNFCNFAIKSKPNTKITTMLGVQSTNKPISGEFAVQFCEQLQHAIASRQRKGTEAVSH